jgi:hypothetical protein
LNLRHHFPGFQWKLDPALATNQPRHNSPTLYVIHNCIYKYGVNTHANYLYYTRSNTLQEEEEEEEEEEVSKKPL